MVGIGRYEIGERSVDTGQGITDADFMAVDCTFHSAEFLFDIIQN